MLTRGRIVLFSPKRAHVDWNRPISQEKYLKIDWSAKMSLHWLIRDLQIGLRVRDLGIVRVSNFKPVTFLESSLYMLVFR